MVEDKSGRPNAWRVAKVRTPPNAWADYARGLGVRLQQARHALGLSQEEVAHRAGISAFTYQKFEKGESKPGTPMNPRLVTLIALSQVLETDVSYLLNQPLPRLIA